MSQLVKIKQPTASSAARWTKCSGSLCFDKKEEKERASAKRGHRIHAYLKDALETDIESAIARLAARSRNAKRRINVYGIKQHIAGDRFLCEKAFGYDTATDTAKMFPEANDRQYENLDGWIYGTPDLVIIRSSVIEVIDYKSTWQDVEEAFLNLQLRTLCLMVARTFNMSALLPLVFYIKPDGSIEPEGKRVMNEMDLDLQADELARAVNAPVEFVSGTHCAYCPGEYKCPATSGVRNET